MTLRVEYLNGQLVVVIPPDLARQSGIVAGTHLHLTANPKSPRFPYTLDELVSDITPERCHPEWDTGPSVGNEVW